MLEYFRAELERSKSFEYRSKHDDNEKSKCLKKHDVLYIIYFYCIFCVYKIEQTIPIVKEGINCKW